MAANSRSRSASGPSVSAQARVVLVRDELVLEAVDAGDDRAEQRARVAADVVRGERQLVDALEQHREPVGGRDRRGERVEPRLERLVVQQARAEAVDGRDGQLLEAAVEPGLEPLAQRVGGGLGDGQDEDRLGREPALAHEPGEALAQHRRLAGAGAAEDEQRAAGVRDGLELAGGQRHHRRIGPVGVSGSRAGHGLAGALPPRDRRAARDPRRPARRTARARARGRHARRGRRPHAGDRRRRRGGGLRASSSALHDEGLRFTAVSEERGTVDFGDPDTLVVVDPIDGSVNAKRGLPHHSISIAVADGADDGRRLLRLRLRLRPRRGVDRAPRQGRVARPARGSSRGGRASAAARDGRLELLGIESADPRWVREVGRGAGRSRPTALRALGTMASTVCQVARGAARRHGLAAALPRGRRRRRRS